MGPALERIVSAVLDDIHQQVQLYDREGKHANWRVLQLLKPAIESGVKRALLGEEHAED